MDIRLYIGNLAKSTTAEEIRTLFSQVGEVSAVDVIMDRATGTSKGFAFVNMPGMEQAQKAINMFNAYELAGNQLNVNIAKPRV